jgi:hypothetical protein
LKLRTISLDSGAQTCPDLSSSIERNAVGRLELQAQLAAQLGVGGTRRAQMCEAAGALLEARRAWSS